MTPPVPRAGRAAARPLPALTVVAGWTLAAVAAIAMLRAWHGSWTTAAQSLLAPAIFIPFVLGLWVAEQVREGPVPWWVAGLVGLAGGAFAGLAASIFVRGLGPLRGNVVIGMLWGTVIALGWVRRKPAPG